MKHAGSDLRRELPPWDRGARTEGRVDRQTSIQGVLRTNGLRMVQHIERVHPELQTLRLRDLERFRDIGVEAPNRKSRQNVLAQVPLFSWLGILEHDQAGSPGTVV